MSQCGLFPRHCDEIRAISGAADIIFPIWSELFLRLALAVGLGEQTFPFDRNGQRFSLGDYETL